ncbi:MAG: DUF2382 domain-containing protein [Pleurocapsa minor HA4230-MV1]|jgi:uncharacterized protein (TIGR02271 family)|nr:DUF2382 domain-containing protein [Pleurocapsa minor HA4230-MV1]
MTLQSIAEFSPNYNQEDLMDNELISKPVFIAQTDEKLGVVEDVLVDEFGHFRYLVVGAGSWLADQKFLLPIGRCRAIQDGQAIAVMDINNIQDLEQLPPYQSDSQLDYDYEESIRNIYRQFLAGDNYEIPNYDRDSYSYDHEPELYQIPTEEGQTIRFYEERLVADKQRHEVGEVTIGKRIETEVAQVEIPVEKEKVFVKIHEVGDQNIAVSPEEAKFEGGTVATFKVHEETAEIKKQAFVHEEVEIKKEVKKEIVNAEETLRKEQLEMTGEENIEIEQSSTSTPENY